MGSQTGETFHSRGRRPHFNLLVPVFFTWQTLVTCDGLSSLITENATVLVPFVLRPRERDPGALIYPRPQKFINSKHSTCPAARAVCCAAIPRELLLLAVCDELAPVANLIGRRSAAHHHSRVRANRRAPTHSDYSVIVALRPETDPDHCTEQCIHNQSPSVSP
ncbi:hypothetical protein CC78DRAFT_279901 [Lojkania enalia]|uniref:Uncharacterized protein n=1 Tax=Lojkania enalia TaxID=147567 RepID=A0A9P4NA58_9PLEO|nr:hypothetical protein CC78DRAFT_279901 [Didymosphaeria enalia]